MNLWPVAKSYHMHYSREVYEPSGPRGRLKRVTQVVRTMIGTKRSLLSGPQFEQESEMHRLRQKLADLELQLAESRRSEIQAREERDLERLRNAMSPHRTPPRVSPNEELINGVRFILYI